MKEFCKAVLMVTATLVICFGILCSCVSCGLQVFAAEIPDITEPSGLSTEELEAVLKHELRNYAQAFIHAEEDYGINAVFLAAVAAQESGWGRYCHQENNIFGFMTGRDFESVEHNIDYVAWFLYKNYIREEGRFHNGATIQGISKCYCDAEWAGYVEGIYRSLYREVLKDG